MAVRIVVTNIRYEDRPMVNVKRSALLDLDIQSFDGRINAIDAALENRKIVFGVVQVRSAANIFFDCMVDGRMPAKLLSDFRIPADLPRTYVG